MIDYFALALGHGLMAIALLRLVLREDFDAEPLIATAKTAIAARRLAPRPPGPQRARRARGLLLTPT